MLVRANIGNESGILKPGMFSYLKLVLQVKEKALVIPETALIMRADKSVVMVVDDENVAQMRTVRTGMRLDGAVEITDGLSEGEKVIVEGHQKVGPGSPVNPSAFEIGETVTEVDAS